MRNKKSALPAASAATALVITFFLSISPLAPFESRVWALGPEDDAIVAEFWTERTVIAFDEGAGGTPKRTPVPIERLLEEARYVFSGMIYGFSFAYTPSDTLRSVEEQFTIEPIAQIPWGDPGLTVMDTREAEDRVYVRIRYFLNEYHGPWITMWQSNTLPTNSAFGEAPVYRGVENKIEAINQGVKQAVRHYLRQRVYNKPKLITGEAVLQSPPRTVIKAGAYRAAVDVKMKFEEVRPYSGF
jgi:hypothetical protein